VEELIRVHRLTEEDGTVLRALISDTVPTFLHDLMFEPSIVSLFDEEQQMRWLPRVRSKEVIGCYAQTEVGIDGGGGGGGGNSPARRLALMFSFW
jgi:hypothetical protein